MPTPIMTSSNSTNAGFDGGGPYQSTKEKFSAPQNSTRQEEPNIYGVIMELGNQTNELKNKIEKLEKEQRIARDFYDANKKLAKTSRSILILLMCVPCAQLVICAAIVYHLGIQDNISPLLDWVLGGISFFSIAEVIITAIKYTSLENKIEDMQKKLEDQ